MGSTNIVSIYTLRVSARLFVYLAIVSKTRVDTATEMWLFVALNRAQLSKYCVGLY